MAKKVKHEDEPEDDKKPGKSKPEAKIPDDPREPYPTGNPPSAEDELRRAAGLPPDAKI